MEEQTQDSVNLEIPSRWRRFSAYLLDFILNIITILIVPSLIITLDMERHTLLITVFTIIICIYLFFIIYKKTTIWNKLTWIITLNNENNPINCRQSLLRFFIFNPAFLGLVLFLIWFSVSLIFYSRDNCTHDPNSPIHCSTTIEFINNIAKRSCLIGLILLFITLIEFFFKCPTFIDKLLWIKRLYKKSKKNNE